MERTTDDGEFGMDTKRVYLYVAELHVMSMSPCPAAIPLHCSVDISMHATLI